MSFIRSFSKNQALGVSRLFNGVQQRNSHFTPDYKPDPYPKTEEARLAAAKKYNLLPEEYEPYDEEEGAGDYPKLPFESVDARDPYYAYDHPELRRNFMEPVHRQYIILFPEMITTEKPRYNYILGLFHMAGALSLVAGFLWYMRENYVVNLPILEKQMPNKGETHYLFPKVHDKKT